MRPLPKKGDRLWHYNGGEDCALPYGWGTVIEFKMNNDNTFAIVVENDNAQCRFSVYTYLTDEKYKQGRFDCISTWDETRYCKYPGEPNCPVDKEWNR